MARLTDGKRSVTIYMGYWTGDQYTPDFSDDFFEVGGLEMNEYGFHVVEDVSYCIGQVEDWCEGRGDYYGAEEDDPHFLDRCFEVDADRAGLDRDDFELMAQDWLADNAEEMEGLILIGDPYICECGSWAQDAEDDEHSYTLHVVDGDICIAYSGAK